MVERLDLVDDTMDQQVQTLRAYAEERRNTARLYFIMGGELEDGKQWVYWDKVLDKIDELTKVVRS